MRLPASSSNIFIITSLFHNINHNIIMSNNSDYHNFDVTNNNNNNNMTTPSSANAIPPVTTVCSSTSSSTGAGAMEVDGLMRGSGHVRKRNNSRRSLDNNGNNSNSNSNMEFESSYATADNKSHDGDISHTFPLLSEQHNEQERKDIDWKTVRKQFRLFRQMALPYYKESISSRWLLVCLLIFTLLNSGISVLFSYVGKDFWNALAAKDPDEFYYVLMKYIGALVIAAPISSLYRYQREQLAVHWREWMTARTFDLYTSNQVYYKLERNIHNEIDNSNNNNTDLEKDGINNDDDNNKNIIIDNPDQRITEDVKSFTSYSLSLLITILTSVIDLISFSIILYSIYPKLFIAIIVYATFGTIITGCLGKKLITLNFLQLQKEANLRYALVRLRENAESIAFYHGEDIEGQQIEKRLEYTMDNKRAINRAQRNLEFFTNPYFYFVSILPIAVIAPQYFAGAVEMGVISQSVGAFASILSDVSIIIDQFEELSAFSAGIERLSTFYQSIRYVDIQRSNTSPLLQPPPLMTTMFVADKALLFNNQDNNINEDQKLTAAMDGSSSSHYSSADNSNDNTNKKNRNNNNIIGEKYGEIDLQRWKYTNDTTVLDIIQLDLVTPDKKRLLIKKLNLSLLPNDHLLIVGNSGAGKSSLLRAIAGLWTIGRGRISRPSDDDVYFLPQRPYCTLGTLKDQLLYPSLDGITNTTTTDINNNNNNNTIGKDFKRSNRIMPKSHWLKQSLTDDDLISILKKVDLLEIATRAGDGDAIRGLYTTLDWSNMLSLGEQQRLAFGRLLVNKPKLCILDECTSALDINAEARMYQLLQDMSNNNNNNNNNDGGTMTYISVGHRPSLISFHKKKLRLGGGDDHDCTIINNNNNNILSSNNNNNQQLLQQNENVSLI